MSNDDTSIEMRARAAGAAVRAATVAQPMPAVARVTAADDRTGRRTTRPSVVWRTVAGVAAAAACVATVVWVVGDDDREPLQPADTALDTRRVIDVLPEGFTVSGAVGPGTGAATSEPQSIEVRSMWWITGTEPGQVAAILPWAEGGNDEAVQSWLTEYTTGAAKIDIDGHTAYLGDSSEKGFEHVRLLLIGGDTEWRQVAARNFDDETLIAIGRAALTDDLTQAPLAAGLELLGQAPPTWTVALTPEPMSLSDGLCIVGYTKVTTVTAGGDTATDEQVIILTTTPDVRMAEAQLDLYFPDRSRVTGTAYARADFPTSGGVEVLTWQVGGVSYLLIGTVSLDELVAAADSVRVPTDDEWDGLLALTAANTAEDGSTGSSVEVAPASTAVAVPDTTGA